MRDAETTTKQQIGQGQDAAWRAPEPGRAC